MDQKVYQALMTHITAMKNCEESENHEWHHKHEESLRLIIDNYLPSGSGIDIGCEIDHEKSDDSKMIIESSYHYMNDNGMYVRWIDFTVKVSASLQHGFLVDITGNFGREQHVKIYLIDLFHECLEKDSDGL